MSPRGDEAALTALLVALDRLEIVLPDQSFRARLSPPAWEDALRDAGGAAEIAARILAANAAQPEGGSASLTLDRALLVLLLPVFDRVIQLLAEGALRIAAQDSAILSDCSPAPRNAAHEQSLLGSFARFGRAIHDYVEQSQALALEEARRAYGGSAPVPHRFAVSAGPSLESAIERLQSLLGHDDAVLQYYLVGGYLLSFAYGRRFFEWHIRELSDVDDAPLECRARDIIERDLDAVRTWIGGLPAPNDDQAIARLCDVLAPPPILASLARARINHLRIVPHDVLYRVPFGRLPLAGGSLASRYSLSIHATGRLAAESTGGLPGPRPRVLDIGFIVGPDIRPDEEKGAIQRAFGELDPLAAWSTSV